MGLSEIKARRAKKAADLEARREAQLEVDYTAIEQLEDEHGATSIRVFEVGAYIPGLPAALAVRCPTGPERKRYQSRLKPSVGRRGNTVPGDSIAASTEIGECCLVYPIGDDREQLLTERPGLLLQAGNLAIVLSEGRDEEEGKG